MIGKLLAALSLLIGGAASAAGEPGEPVVVVVVDDAGRHYAGLREGGPDAAAFVRLRDPLVLGEDRGRALRLWPMSWAEWVGEMDVRAARYWSAGPLVTRQYGVHRQRFKAEYAATHSEKQRA